MRIRIRTVVGEPFVVDGPFPMPPSPNPFDKDDDEAKKATETVWYHDKIDVKKPKKKEEGTEWYHTKIKVT